MLFALSRINSHYYNSQTTAPTEGEIMKIGILFNTGSMWIGVHYSDYTKRYCINILPCITIWVAEKNGGKIPDKAQRWIDCEKL